MIITLYIDDFLFEIFPFEKNDKERTEKYLREFYTINSIEPIITFEEDKITIELNTDLITRDNKTYNRLIQLCEKSDFINAKHLVEELIKKSPNVSDYHRILGQILSDQGEQEEAINSLIEALRWNPTNESALIMMGNIFAKHKEDVETALKYYNQVIKVNHENYLALNNIGANLINNNQSDEGLKFLEKAKEVNSEYPNTYYAIAIIHEKNGQYEQAFENVLDAIKYNKSKDDLFNRSVQFSLDIAKTLIIDTKTQKIINEFILKLEEKTGKPIKTVEDKNITTAAKIEYAENYKRDYHLVKYKADYPAVDHLIMHELLHLELAQQAREVGAYKLFTTNQSLKISFINSMKNFTNKLMKKGVNKIDIDKYLEGLFNGINQQIFNTPIDLFIEDIIFNDYLELRPNQYVSLLNLINQGIEATTNKEIVKNTPETILSKSKILNLVNAIQFKKLYNLDLINRFKATNYEVKKANKLYEEYLEQRRNRKPGIEYNLIEFWADDLNLSNLFELIPEEETDRTIEKVVSEIKSDPFDLNKTDLVKERKMKEFLENHSDDEINNAVTMYMLSAIKYFSKLDQTKIKEIAFEFATLGMSGIDPNKDGYSIPSIENTKFTGYKALSFYYVSWAIAIPEMLSQLKMPFDKEYKLANKLNGL